MRWILPLLLATFGFSAWLFSPRDEAGEPKISLPQVLRLAPPDADENAPGIAGAISAAVAGAGGNTTQYQGNAEAIAADKATLQPDPHALAMTMGLSLDALRNRLTPPLVNADQIAEIIAKSPLPALEKAQLTEELTALRNHPESLAKFLTVVRRRLGFDG